MRRLETGSPRSICFASATSSAAVSSLWRPTSARKSCSESADLEADRLELALKRLGLVFVELVLEDERLELRRLHEAALLGALDQRTGLFGLEQFDQLVLRQLLVSVLSLRPCRSL
jgi:hypothetical protein